MRERVTTQDMEAAIEWLQDGYEGEDETLASLLKVAAYLRAEVERRNTEKAVSEIVRQTGVSRARARAKLKSVYSPTLPTP